jgi:anaphase-promoting complex subunit 3
MGVAATATVNILPMKALFKACAYALRLLWTYKCSEAVTYLMSDMFPARQKTSGWYLTTLGRAHYENGMNEEAAKQWSLLRRKEPWRVISTLVFYSTALWHLRREKELSLLAQQLIEAEPHSAITLCVAGNFYSLVKDQTQALKMLHRATQVDRSFAYAHTLKGYEHLNMEECSEAEQCFRTALRIEPRHYLAIGGLGEVNSKQGHHVTARQHFQQALGINPYPALYARLACTLMDDMTHDAWVEALHLFDEAIVRDPSNLRARHHRAELYMKLGQHSAAMPDLEHLRVKCPKEAGIFITLARCHRKLGNKQQAMFFFNHAVDLDDQWSSTAKVAIDKLTQEVPAGSTVSDSD